MTPERDEPIIDVLLEEALGGVSPPDLSARIMQAWAARNGAAPVAGGSKRAKDLLPPAVTDSGNTPIPIAQPAAAAPLVVTSPGSQRRRRTWTSWLVTAGVSAAMLPAMYLVLRNFPANQVVEKPSKPNEPKLADKAPRTPAAESPTRQNPAIVKQRVPHQPPPAPREMNEQPGTILTPADEPREEAPQIAMPKRPIPATIEPSTPREVISFVNTQFTASWKENKVTPAPAAADSEWCRRVFLRVLGRIPTVDELDAFLKDNKRGDRRERLVDRLLESELYADELSRQWGTTWTNILIGRTGGTEKDDVVSRAGLEAFLAESFRNRVPYNELVVQLLTAEGSARPGSEHFQGAVNFLLAGYDDDAVLATSRVARLFLGVNMQCAQCHNHPTNAWDQRDFWALNAFLRQMKVEGKGAEARLVDRDLTAKRGDVSEAEVYYQTPSGVLKAAYPRFIDGTEIPRAGEVAKVDRRQLLADFVTTSPEFPRAFINRLWSQFFSYGFTRPVDDIGQGNPPSEPEVLDRLAQEFVAHGYSIRAAMKWIALSDPFGRSSKIPPNNFAADSPESGTLALFSRYYTRQMEVDEVYDSLLIAARMRKTDNANQAAAPGILAQTRGDWASQFSRKMGTDDGAEESTFDGSMRQSLIMMNGDLMKRATSPDHAGLLQSVIKSPLKFEEKVEHLFLAALSRKPIRKELDAARSIASANRGDESTTLQDLWWALLNSNEFILDH